MTSPRIDLRDIGESALKEVLCRLGLWPAGAQPSPDRTGDSETCSPIPASVPLDGPMISGTVRLEIPEVFLSRAALHLIGVVPLAVSPHLSHQDLAGEIANMVAGQVAARLRLGGYSCQLGIPSVFREADAVGQPPAGMDSARSDLVWEGRRLSIEIECRYTLL